MFSGKRRSPEDLKDVPINSLMIGPAREFLQSKFPLTTLARNVITTYAKGHGLFSVLTSIESLQRRAGSWQSLKISDESYFRALCGTPWACLKSTPYTRRDIGPVIIPCIQLLPNRQLDNNTIFPACTICGMDSQGLDLPTWQHPLLKRCCLAACDAMASFVTMESWGQHHKSA